MNGATGEIVMYGGYSRFMYCLNSGEQEYSDQCISILKMKPRRMVYPGLRLYVETNNSTAQKTYEALGMNSQHYKMYEWMKE